MRLISGLLRMISGGIISLMAANIIMTNNDKLGNDVEKAIIYGYELNITGTMAKNILTALIIAGILLMIYGIITLFIKNKNSAKVN